MVPQFLHFPSSIEKNLKLVPHSPEWKLLSQITAVRCGIIDPEDFRALQFELNQLFEEINSCKKPPLSPSCVLETIECEHEYNNRMKFWNKMLKERKRLSRRIQKKTGKSKHDVLFNRSLVNEQESCMVKRIMDCSDEKNPEKRYPTSENSHNDTRESWKSSKTKQEIKEPPKSKKKFQKSLSTCKKESTDRVKKKCVELKEAVCKKVRKMTEVKTKEKATEHVKKYTNEKAKPEEIVVKNQDLKNITSYKASEISKSQSKVRKRTEMLAAIDTGIKVNKKVLNIGTGGEIPHVELEKKFECFPHQQVKKRIFRLENIGLNTLTLSLKEQQLFPENSCLQCSRHNKILTDPILFHLGSGEKRNINILYEPRKVGVFQQRWILKVCTDKYMCKSGDIVLKICGRCIPTVKEH